MSLDRSAPQAYAPLRLKQSEIGPFFKSVRDRKVARGHQPNTVKVVTTKPFEENPRQYVKAKSVQKKSAVKRSASPSPVKTKKRKKIIEKKLRDVKL